MQLTQDHPDELEDDLVTGAYGRSWRPEPARQWFFVDERGIDRFTHVGDSKSCIRRDCAWRICVPQTHGRLTCPVLSPTVSPAIVPGAGVRWKHVHKESGEVRGRPAATPSYTAAAWLFGAAAYQVARVEQDDNKDELPWQVRHLPRY